MKKHLKKHHFRCLGRQTVRNYEHGLLARLRERSNIMATSRGLSSTSEDLDKYIAS
jgi:hypothetical protein